MVSKSTPLGPLSVTFVTGGRELTRTLTVTRVTRASITFRGDSAEFCGTWTVKFATIGNEGPHSNRLISVAS